MWRSSNSRTSERGLKRDPQLGRLLSEFGPSDEVLPWSEVRRLVASAPPVRAAWGVSLLHTGVRPLRYALATFMLLGLGSGLLALTPAQSDVVGTTVLTVLPAEWPVNGQAFAEVEQAAAAQFKTLAVPQGDMFIKVGPAQGRQQLAFALLGVERDQAAAFFGALQDKYPALRVAQPSYSVIDTDRAGSRLNELVLGVLRPERLQPLATGELKAYVLKSLQQCGFDDIKLKVYRGADGTTYIEVDARMSIAVTGRTQEELEQSGLSQQVVGDDVFRELLQAAGAPNPD